MRDTVSEFSSANSAVSFSSPWSVSVGSVAVAVQIRSIDWRCTSNRSPFVLSVGDWSLCSSLDSN